MLTADQFQFPETAYDFGLFDPRLYAMLYVAQRGRGDDYVVQLSVQPCASPAHHLAAGVALAPLDGEGVQTIGSGSATHNLHALFHGGYREDLPPGLRGDCRLPQAGAACGRQPPSKDHFLPLPVAMVAAGLHAKGDFFTAAANRCADDGRVSIPIVPGPRSRRRTAVAPPGRGG